MNQTKPTGGLWSGIRRGWWGMRQGYKQGHAARLEDERVRPPRRLTWAATVALLAILAVGILIYAAPQVFRLRGIQTPVNVTLRSGVLTANVVRVQNLSRDHIANVVVTARRPNSSQAESRRLGTLAPGQVMELGGLEWDWVVRAGDTVTVNADGFLPVVFSSDQMVGR
ncbi:MAG: hypothetical protein L0219_22790 [Phycisphaerales bacterium]|nr:hypothetical protein [Phycisphaerales bacterium]